MGQSTRFDCPFVLTDSYPLDLSKESLFLTIILFCRALLFLVKIYKKIYLYFVILDEIKIDLQNTYTKRHFYGIIIVEVLLFRNATV